VYFMDVMSRRYGIRPDDRFSQTFDQTFDLSVFDLFMAWSNGACVYAMSPVDLLSPRSSSTGTTSQSGFRSRPFRRRCSGGRR
jgi:hypothetical protein